MVASVETLTIGAVTYSVYGFGNADPVADADDYFAARLGATSWTDATTLQKQQGLVSAARMMDRVVQWTGTKTVSTQPLAFPRDSSTCRGTAVADGTIPDGIVYGQFELALALLADATLQDSAGTGSNIKRAKAGSAEVEFFLPTIGGSGAGALADNRFPTAVQDLVECYIKGGSSAVLGGGLFVDGTTTTSSFDCDDDYDLTRGYP